MNDEIIVKNYKNKCVSSSDIQEIMEHVYSSLHIIKEINPYMAYFAIKTIRKCIKKENIIERRKSYD